MAARAMATLHKARAGHKIIDRLAAWDKPIPSKKESMAETSHKQWFNSKFSIAGPLVSRLRLRSEMELEAINVERTARQARARTFHLALSGACGHDSHQIWARQEQVRLVTVRRHRLLNRLSSAGAGNRGSKTPTQSKSRGVSFVNRT